MSTSLFQTVLVSLALTSSSAASSSSSSAISSSLLRGAVPAVPQPAAAAASSLDDVVTVTSDSDPQTPLQTLISGADDAKFLGFSVSSAGDVNGDGIDDIIVGVPRKNSPNRGQEVGAAFCIFGRQAIGQELQFLQDFTSLDDIDGTNGFAIYGDHLSDHVGFVVSRAGDINGDGLADVIVGAPRGDLFEAGQAYVIFGSNQPFEAAVHVDALDGSNGFVVQGNNIQDFFGSSVAHAGDVNGDGIDDIIVGAPNAGDGGEAYVIYGSTGTFSEILFVTDLNGENGFVLEAEGALDNFGRTVAPAGDVNHDGISDIIVGAISATNPQGARSGAVYVIYGSSDLEATVRAGSIVDGTDGFKIYGTAEKEEFGHAVASVGDVNGDGIDDFVVGCPLCRPEGGNYSSGIAFIFYGGASPSLETASSMVFGEESFDGLGQAVSSAGDLNGDGMLDILIASSRSVGAGKNAELHIIHGSQSDLPGTILAQDVERDNVGAVIQLFSRDFNGKNDRVVSASSAGDFNHDGAADIIIGLPSVKVGNDAPTTGMVKILWGHSS